MNSDDDRIEQALAQIVAKRGDGGPVSVEAIVAENPDLEEPLRARLRVLRMLDGLREASRGQSTSSGVFESLSRAGTSIHPLSLPDSISDDATPVLIPRIPAGRWGRYSVEGEIARGGVGVVLRARDPDLGRDVALKVLRDEFAGSSEVLQRFVEEAQVGGQLQHPGIVPVYELGLGGDGQPYFVMKLVKGKTFASLLAQRQSAAHDRPRFLAVFQTVCQTIAYAHDRRILHRDLKPSNVMVGSFGEVQVLDWGMAKLLARGGAEDDARANRDEAAAPVRTVRSSSGSAPSVEGSVLGTPQYMAPEQARGAVDRLDERADVFSLGAILCEILTGTPPYLGSPREVLAAAAQARIQPALERLRACGADPELVTLATRCLAAETSDRPRDAGALAREVTQYLTSLEDRARKAEIEARETRVVAAQERRSRRLTLALCVAVVAFLLVGGGGWYWIDAQRRTRAEAIARQVASALDDATLLRAKAEATGAEEALPLWREALAAARRADGLASTGDADDETRRRATIMLSQATESSLRADAVAAQRRHDEATVAKLEDIRTLAGETWNWRTTSAAYDQVFAEILGGDIESLGLDDAARRIDASRIRAALVMAIRFWIRARYSAHDERGFLPDLLARIDSNPWQAKFRRAGTDVDALRALAKQVDFDALDVQDVTFLAGILGRAGDPVEAARLAYEAWRRHPADFWACFTCAEWNQRSSPPRVQEALRFYTGALAIRPQSAAVRINVGTLLRDLGKIEAAKAEFREAVRLAPALATAHGALGTALYMTGDIDGAIKEHTEALRLDPNDPNPRLNLGRDYVAKGEFDRAVASYREATRLDPNRSASHVGAGAALAMKGDLGGAIAEFREAVRLEPSDSAAHNNLGYVLSQTGDTDGAMSEFQEAIRLDATNAEAHRNLATSLRARGRFRESLDEFRRAHDLGSVRKPWNHPTAREIQEVERLIGLADRLTGLIQGHATPANAHEALDMAQVGYLMGAYVASSTAWARGLEMEPSLASDTKAGYRYNAACAAALAAGGHGTDAKSLDAAGRARWLRQAIAWLRADLDVRIKEGDAQSLRASLEHWTKDADLASVRDSTALEHVSMADRDTCQALWGDVARWLSESLPPK